MPSLNPSFCGNLRSPDLQTSGKTLAQEIIYASKWIQYRIGEQEEENATNCNTSVTYYNPMSFIKKGSFYIAQYLVRWTAQSASHFLPSLTDLFIPIPFSASPGSILARQQLRANTKSLTFPPQVLIYTAESTGASMERTKMPNPRNGTKGGFEPGLTRLRVRHSTTELPRSMARSISYALYCAFQSPLYTDHSRSHL